MTRADIVSKMKHIAFSRYRFILLIISGICTGLTLVFPVVGFFEWITLVPMGLVLLLRASERETKLRSLYLDGLSFFYPFYIVCFHWFVNLYPLDFIEEMTKPAALAVVMLGCFGLSLLQALMGGVLFLFCGLLFRCRLFAGAEVLKPVAVSLAYAVYEWTQTVGWWGVPWGRLPIGQTKYLVGIQTAALFGSYFVTFTILLVNMLFAFALLKLVQIKAARVVAIAAACVLVFNYGCGSLIFFTHNLEKGSKIRVACIQGNFPSNVKWNVNKDEVVERYREYTNQAAKMGAELVIYPETAFPNDLEDHFKEDCINIAKESGVHLLVGTFTDNEAGESRNSLVCFMPNGEMCENIYAKRHLVPFGEYMPMGTFLETLIPPLAQLEMSSKGIVSGDSTEIIEIESEDGKKIELGSLICFDSIYEELVYDSTKDGAQLFCLATNDSWFTDSAALYMHNAQAQIRAVESGRYFARAANTGVSTVITSRGEVVEHLEPLVGGFVVRDVYARSERTLWSYIGNSFVYVSALLLSAICIEEVVKKTLERVSKKRKI